MEGVDGLAAGLLDLESSIQGDTRSRPCVRGGRGAAGLARARGVAGPGRFDLLSFDLRVQSETPTHAYHGFGFEGLLVLEVPGSVVTAPKAARVSQHEFGALIRARQRGHRSTHSVPVW